MKFNLFGRHLSLTKKGICSITLDDLLKINNDQLKYVKGLDQGEIARRLDSITVNDFKNKDLIERLLMDEGIVVIKNFIPDDALIGVDAEIDYLCKASDDLMSSGAGFFQGEKLLIQAGHKKINGYADLQNHDKAIIDIRQGQDQGMIDVFNVDKWSAHFQFKIRPYFENDFLGNLGVVLGNGVSAKNLNLYLNRSIKKTRGFHVDSYRKQLKGFVYLTDCMSLGDGPYTYVVGSHKETPYSKINRAAAELMPNGTETPFVNLQKIIPIFAKRGSLVISDQGGSHRGFPQDESGRRAVAVMNYK
jgi:hypothetical protein